MGLLSVDRVGTEREIYQAAGEGVGLEQLVDLTDTFTAPMNSPHLRIRRGSPSGLCPPNAVWISGLWVAGLWIAALVSIFACTEPTDELSKAQSTRAAAAPPDVVILSMDTVRPDHLGLYGYERDTSPHVDRLAERSVVFERALAPTPLTVPSHLSVFTGRQPWTHRGHGVRKNGIPLGTGVPFLAAELQAAGWKTGGFVSGFPLTDEMSGFSRGFDVYDDEVSDLRRPGEQTVDAALDWWRAADSETPRFLFVHLYDAHGPYLVPNDLVDRYDSEARGPWADKVPQYQRRIDPKTGGIITNLRHYIDRYDASIRATDRQVGRVLRELDPQRTVVLVMSDHGETLDERVFPLDHGSRLYEEQIRSVAVLAAPGLAPGRVDAMVSLADFGPTLLDLAGLGAHALGQPEGEVHGRSLRPLMSGQRDAWRSQIRLATTANAQVPKQRRLGLGGKDFLAGIVDDAGWKLIVYSGDDPARELYRLDDDPLEADNLAATGSEHLQRLQRNLLAPGPEILRPPDETLELDDEAKAALLSLGYVFD